jgi:signal transduction histidine kinase
LEPIIVSDPRHKLADGYALALERYFVEPGEPALARAHDLGRQALADRLGVLEVAVVHSRMVASALNRSATDDERAQRLEALEKFFLEALSPFEMAHRGFWEANGVLRRLNEMLEGQAKRIASALHDAAVQLLASVHLALADIASRLPDDVAGEIRAARSLLDQTEERLRNLAHQLRPPILDDLGLVAALEFLADVVSKRWGLAVTVESRVDRPLPATIETTLYRITQEALTNVARHAKATHAWVLVQQAASEIVCSIRDDGIGCDQAVVGRGTASRGLGLTEIRERVAALGGVFQLRPNQPHGTNLAVAIPLERGGSR